MDISHTEMEVGVVGGEHTLTRRDNRAEDHLRDKSTVEDGWICGNGVRNMKSAMAALLRRRSRP